MKLVTIKPVQYEKCDGSEPIGMYLTHLVEDCPEYRKVVAENKTTYKILDNSLIELKGALSMERLVKAADMINADEIILEDAFLDCDKTIELAEKAINYLKENNLLGKYKLMAVAHGKNKEEWEKCFNKLDSIKEIDVIGVPKVCSTWLESENRGELAPIFMKSKKKIHFLGVYYNLKELIDLPKEVFDKVRSCDTCLPSVIVLNNKELFERRAGTIDLKGKYGLSYNEFEDKYKNLKNQLNEEALKKYGESI